MKNMQDFFNKTREHLLKQNKRAFPTPEDLKQNREFKPTQCVYRSSNGLKCAIGVHIPDGHGAQLSHLGVEEMLEVNPDLYEVFGVEMTEGGPDSEDIDFLEDLQILHDDTPPAGWDKDLKELAERWGLE